ncbi:MAG: RsmE family RNA methyltransferase [Kiritimatiellae bacterium]|nr:RsmE family RNA methyltransferase [Kiritimatiellia bacterium]
MNRILFEPNEINLDGNVTLRGVRADHIRSVLKAKPGQTLKTGTINGPRGTSTVLEVSNDQICLRCYHTKESPEPWFDLILAAPRPLVLKRLWPQLATLGAGKIFLVKASKVEKYYFSSQWVEAETVRALLIEGAVQAGSTHIPEFEIKMNFSHFMESELERLAPHTGRLLAHPGPVTRLRREWCAPGGRPLIAVGPEGGWTDSELKLFDAHGFSRFSLGERILRSDTACIALISVLDYCRG